MLEFPQPAATVPGGQDLHQSHDWPNRWEALSISDISKNKKSKRPLADIFLLRYAHGSGRFTGCLRPYG